jgi:two-component system sensor kinase FixL
MGHPRSPDMACSSDAKPPLTTDAFYAHDWRTTPLGHPEGWSDLLRLWVQFLLASVQPMAILWGPEQTLLFNESCSRIIGPRYPEALGQSLPQLWAQIWDRVKPLMGEISAGRSGLVQDMPFGTWASNFTELRYFSAAYSPIQSLDGDVAGALATVTDTTDKYLQKERILRERDALHELFEQAPGFIAMVEGPEHRYTLSNAANNRLLDRTDVVGKTVLEAFPELVQQGVIAILDEVYATGTPFIAHSMPFTIRRGDGSGTDAHYIDTIYQPIRDEKKQIIGIFVEGHDVTAHRRTQERVQALQTDLIHLSRASAMDAMASTIAHELNQPLASIANYVEAARRMVAEPTDSRLTQCLDGAAKAALRAGKVIRTLRDMTTRGHVNKSPIDLAVTIKEAVLLVIAGNPGISVTYDFGTASPVLADAVQIQQVVINLVRNAFEASASGRTHIEISVCSKDDQAEICIGDDGPGIPKELLPSLFDSFTTTKEAGMGVGLSICRTIIEAHGGRIWAGNREDGGAIVCFTVDQADGTEEV